MDKLILKRTAKGADGKSQTSQYTVGSVAELKQGVENLVYDPNTLRIVIDGGEKPVKAVKPSVKARTLEWELDESYPKGERWVGKLNGYELAHVIHFGKAWGGDVSYGLDMKPFDVLGNAATVASGKTMVQRALTQAVKILVK